MTDDMLNPRAAADDPPQRCERCDRRTYDTRKRLNLRPRCPRLCARCFNLALEAKS
jgi:hypothetical protein